MQEGISVIICCYNSSLRLAQTINHLAQQEIPSDLNWEIIIINNCSTDNTKEVAKSELKRCFFKNSTNKIIDELNPGLSNARKRGVLESSFKYLLFCDDDNWLSKKYLITGYKTFLINEKIGIIGGKGIEQTEVPAPLWFDKYKLMYAVGPHADKTGNITETRGDVYGAGAFFKKQALLDLYDDGFVSKLAGRNGNKLSSGEDNELCICIKLLGYQIWYNDELTFYHFIPKERLTNSHLLKLNIGISESFAHLRPYYYITNSKLNLDKRGWLRSQWLWFFFPRLINYVLSNNIYYSLIYRLNKKIDTNVINAESSLIYLKTIFIQKNKFIANYNEIKFSKWYKKSISNR